jgi:hypothetical protein
MGYAADMLRFFSFANARRDPISNALIPYSLGDFLETHSIIGQAAMIVQKVAHILTTEALLIPRYQTSHFFGQT